MLFMLFFCAGIAGCTKNGSEMSSQDFGITESGNLQNESRLKVVTSIFAAYDFARQVGLEYADVSLLLKPGSEAHSFEPTPADIISIEKCDIFICTGGENDAWVEKILGAVDNPDLVVIKMMDCAEDLFEEEEKEGMQAEGGFFGIPEQEDGHEEWDEHVWMDTDNAVNICSKIYNTFTELAPEHADIFRRNYEAYAAELMRVDKLLTTLAEESERRELIFADRFPARYFTERYGLDYYAAFPGCSENAEASAATVSFLIRTVRSEKVPVVIQTELSAGRLAAIVSEETGAAVETFYTGHNVSADDFESGVTFVQLLERNAELLKKALY